MKVKVKITTPKGQALKLKPQLEKFIIGFKGKDITSFEAYVNNEDDTMYFEIEGTIKKILKIRNNLSKFDVVMQKGMKDKRIRKLAGFDSTPEKEQEIDLLLSKLTTCEIVKEATANELVEYNMTFWDRMKKRFKRIEDVKDEG